MAEEVHAVLLQLKIPEYAAGFAANHWTMEALKALSPDQLQDVLNSLLPVNKSGHKLKIKRAVQAWTPQRQAPYGVSSVSTAGGGAAPDTAPLPHTPVMQAVVVSPSSTFTGAAPVAAAVVRNDAAAQPAGQPPPPYVAQPQPQPQPGMCARCGVRPAFTNRQTGQRHDYCGKRCAGEALAGLGMPPGGAAPKPHHQPQQPQQQMCAACGVNPANLPHLFCSRRCAGTQQVAGGGAGGSMAAGSVPPVGAAPSLSVMHRKADPGMCRFCNAQPAMQGHPFCGRRCKNRATEAGWVKGNPPDLATCFAQLEPELTQVLQLEKRGETALMDRRWLRIRAPPSANAIGGPAQAVDVEWKVRPTKKGQQWQVEIFLEPPGGGTGNRTDVQIGGGVEMTGYSASPVGHTLRLEVQALPGGNSGNIEVSYKLRPSGAPDPATAAASAAAAGAASVPAAAVNWDYDAGAFDTLEGLRKELTAGWDKKSPTDWIDIPQDVGITVPFSQGVLAVKMRVIREFSSKAMPFWVQFLDATGNKTDTVMKTGDDLRQDQVILGMLELFNSIWKREGVVHIIAGSMAVVPVYAPLYRCSASGISRGFVEMLPRSTPVEDIVAKASRADNGWRSSNEIVPSAVAGFMSIWALDIRDRHQGNMVVTEKDGGFAFANIDFGWVEEGPPVDTGRFPIPQGLRYLLDSSKMKAEFHDLCFDAVRCLWIHRAEIKQRWVDMLVHRGLNDRVLVHDVPERVHQRIAIPREELDKQLDGTTGGALNTWLKNTTHAVGGYMK